MRNRLVVGLKNSQKIRVIVNGVAFHTTVQGALEGMSFVDQRLAVSHVLTELGLGQFNLTDKPLGIGKPVRVFNHKNERVTVDVQVDLV
ncbi:MAG: hypothetical protein EB127_00610 [Alphaproteobacteria bacterium]|nr:hypothetical protein [Alphaproteobacteria bacterium]